MASKSITDLAATTRSQVARVYDEIRYDQDAGQGGTAGVTVNLATGTATDGFGNTDTLSGIEAVRGTNQADSLTGGLAANDISGEYFYGLGGNDTISGGSGFDEVRYDQDASFGGALGVTVNLATGTATDGFGNTEFSVGDPRCARYGAGRHPHWQQLPRVL